MNDDPDDEQVRLRRLRYRSWHRGCKETDVILGRFSDRHLETLTLPERDVYEALLDEQDVDIWNWLVEKERPSKAEYGPILDILRRRSVELHA